MKRFFLTLIFSANIALLSAQNIDSLKMYSFVKDYIFRLIDLNYNKNIVFKESYDSLYMYMNVEKIIEITGGKSGSEIYNLKYNILEKCDSSWLVQIDMFFINMQKLPKNKTGKGEFFPSKVPIRYYWWNVIDENILVFTYSSTESTEQIPY